MTGWQAMRAGIVYVAWFAFVGASAWLVGAATFELCGGNEAIKAGAR